MRPIRRLHATDRTSMVRPSCTIADNVISWKLLVCFVCYYACETVLCFLLAGIKHWSGGCEP